MTNKPDNLLEPEDTKVGVEDLKNKVEGKKDDNSKDELIEKLLKRVERLEETSNKKRLENYDRLNQEDPETIFKLRVIDGKVITGWSNLHTNKAEVDPVTRKIIENQTLTIYYEDGKEEKMSLIIFNRRYQYIYTTLIEEKILRKPEDKEKYGNRIFKVETDEGKKYSIGEKFIN